jgi:hypothetical protein
MGIDIIHYRMRTTHGAHRCPHAGKIMTVGQLKKKHDLHTIANYIGVTLGGGGSELEMQKQIHWVRVAKRGVRMLKAGSKQSSPSF